MKKIIVTVAAVVFVALIFAAINPFSHATKRFEGKVVSISEGGVKDAVVKLQNCQTTFYINRGFEKFNTEELNAFNGKSAVIDCSNDFTLLPIICLPLAANL